MTHGRRTVTLRWTDEGMSMVGTSLHSGHGRETPVPGSQAHPPPPFPATRGNAVPRGVISQLSGDYFALLPLKG